MRSCLGRRVCHGPSHQAHGLLNGRRITSPGRYRLGLRFAHAAEAHLDSTASTRFSRTEGLRSSQRVEEHDRDAWIARLDRRLPGHLRANSDTPKQHSKTADNLATIVVDAQRQAVSGHGIDLLFHLGINQDRWRAVVWLVKHLVETYAPPYSTPGRLASTLCPSTSQETLNEITRSPEKVRRFIVPQKSLSAAHSLDELTGDLKPENLNREGLLRHDVLGSIWRSLGLMSIACAHGEMRPEILEIIAYLHHMEIMPASIYNQKRSADLTSIQQPPMLNVFSSRILTSLSDAAWRAHEKHTAEEARAKAGQNLASQPGIPGAAVRMNVAGLRPEVWVELILWSCLHGGWILEGAAILFAIYSEPKPRQWQPLSWNSLFLDGSKTEDWDKLAYLFNTRKTEMMEDTFRDPATSVRRTISSEVVNAYVDALLTTIRLGVGERGAAPKTVLKYLSTLQRFLQRSDLSLQTGSWDAVILRYFENQETVVDQGHNFEMLVGLSSGIGEELNAENRRDLPEYVLDGSAAVLGLFHRALRSRIARGDMQGALRLFNYLQDLADKNKHQSVVDFFRQSRLLAHQKDQDVSEMFTSNFPGIEYPVFNMQIPPTVLGPFMELTLDAKEYTFGKWLLYSDEIDEPVLPMRLYGHSAVAPALVRFAAETSDTTLLSKLLRMRPTGVRENDQSLGPHLLQSFFESQVTLARWDAAERMLRHGQASHDTILNPVTVSYVIRAMLLQVRGNESGDSNSVQNLARARNLLSDMIQSQYERNAKLPKRVREQVTLLLAMLATLSTEWSQYCLSITPLRGIYSFAITARAFDLVLEGVVSAYGSVAGRRLLETFWSADVRDSRKLGRRISQDDAGELRMTRYVPSVLETTQRKRSVITIPGHPEEEVIFYGGVEPSLTTIRIVLRKAIGEMTSDESSLGNSPGSTTPLSAASSDARKGPSMNRQKDSASFEMIAWAIEAFRSLQMIDEDIKHELEKDLSAGELEAVYERFPELSEVHEEQAVEERDTRQSATHEESVETATSLAK